MENIPVEINEVIDSIEVTTNKVNNTSDLDDLLKNSSKEEILAKFAKIHDEENSDKETVEVVTTIDGGNTDHADGKIVAHVSGVNLDISDIPIDEDSAYVSSVLGNLDDEPEQAVESETMIDEVNFGIDFNDSENIDFTKEADGVDQSVEGALKDDVVTNFRNEEKYVYHSYADNKVSTRGNNPKLAFMDKINVDLNNITITNKSPIQQAEDINLVFNSNVATFTVTCCQSGYTADMSGLTLSEKNAINNSDGGDLFQFRQRLYKTVYNKIQSMSIKKPDFNTWLKITSFNDLSTLLFGIYCQTFIDNNDFDITCGKCGKSTSVTVNNQSLIEVRDRNAFKKLDEILNSTKSGEELIATSVIHKDERIMLNDSKIVVDVATPSLYDHMVMLKISKQETLQEYADAFSAMLFISHLYMLDVKETYSTGHAVYYEVTDKPRLLNILLKLSSRDGEQLENAIEEKLGQYKIDYQIHNVTCSHCKTKLPGIPVDIETILFTRINRT